MRQEELAVKDSLDFLAKATLMEPDIHSIREVSEVMVAGVEVLEVMEVMVAGAEVSEVSEVLEAEAAVPEALEEIQVTEPSGITWIMDQTGPSVPGP